MEFPPFRPGLVGGHCIGVDPYYLTHKAQSIGFHPEMILAGRRINDGMAAFVARDIIKVMVKRKLTSTAPRVLVMGFTFKENCPTRATPRSSISCASLAASSMWWSTIRSPTATSAA